MTNPPPAAASPAASLPALADSQRRTPVEHPSELMRRAADVAEAAPDLTTAATGRLLRTVAHVIDLGQVGIPIRMHGSALARLILDEPPPGT